MNRETFNKAMTADRNDPHVRRVYADFCEERGELDIAERKRKEADDIEAKWHYSGDVDLRQGGMFIDISEWHWGFASVVRVEDWESATGFTGTVLIERLTVNVSHNTQRIKDAFRFTGRIEQIGQWKIGKTAMRIEIVESLVSSGFYDREEDGLVVQCDRDGPMEMVAGRSYDLSKADLRIRGGDLEGLVRAKYLKG